MLIAGGSLEAHRASGEGSFPKDSGALRRCGGASRCPRKTQGSYHTPCSVRTKNRSRSPGPRASGLWNNVAKGSRQNGGVTLEEALALTVERLELATLCRRPPRHSAHVEGWGSPGVSGRESSCASNGHVRTVAASGNLTVYLKQSLQLGHNGSTLEVIPAQCLECQNDEIQPSTGKRRE